MILKHIHILPLLKDEGSDSFYKIKQYTYWNFIHIYGEIKYVYICLFNVNYMLLINANLVV